MSKRLVKIHHRCRVSLYHRVIYKHMGLATSADKSAGYSTSVMTESDGSYSFNSLPSGVYRFTVTYPDAVIQTIENYAVSPSSSSSYVFRE